MKLPPQLNIKNYKADGFQKAARIIVPSITVDDLEYFVKHWVMVDVREDLIFSDHRSWVYCIVLDDKWIMKLGETGLPLGLRRKQFSEYERNLEESYGPQPLTGTNNRFGRLTRFGDVDNADWVKGDTDVRIRSKLANEAREGRISLWVRQCEVTEVPVKVAGKEQVLKHAFHKDLEKAYLTRMLDEGGQLPILNSAKI